MKALYTLEEWQTIPPVARGYVLYMQAELPGSELKGQTNPYAAGTANHELFRTGERRAVLEVQDGEE